MGRISNLIIMATLSLPGVVADAATISWVDFSGYPTGAQTVNGLQSSSGLMLNASFSTLVNMNLSRLHEELITLDDPTWPFANSQLSTLGLISQFPAILNTELTFNFTNPGGLPAGGSLAIVDLEQTVSFVRLTGYQGGAPVDVDWSVVFYQTVGVNVAQPIWNPVTDTLTGSGQQVGTIANNFAFLSSDRQLDSLKLTIRGMRADGFSFGISDANVAAAAAAAIPEPTSLALLGLTAVGFCGVRLRRRRNHQAADDRSEQGASRAP